jgi:hypothetical protein
MKKSIATVLSFIFHPVFMPLAGLFILFNSGIYGLEVQTEFKRFVYIITLLCNVLLPVTTIPVLIYLKNMHQATFDERKRRLLPLFFGTICMFMGYYLVARFSPIRIINQFLFSVAVVTFLILIISMFWKISIHMAGLGGITALIAVLSVAYKADMTFILCITLLVSGIIASARLSVKAHSASQLLTGYALGLVTAGVILAHLYI